MCGARASAAAKPPLICTAAALSDHALDVCHCGDYRRDHPNDGPCNFNQMGLRGGLTHGFIECLRFDLTISASPP